MKKYYQSLERFHRIDGNNYGACLKQVHDPKQNIYLEWRIAKGSNDMHIIEYYPNGNGYMIYTS